MVEEFTAEENRDRFATGTSTGTSTSTSTSTSKQKKRSKKSTKNSNTTSPTTRTANSSSGSSSIGSLHSDGNGRKKSAAAATAASVGTSSSSTKQQRRSKTSRSSSKKNTSSTSSSSRRNKSSAAASSSSSSSSSRSPKPKPKPKPTKVPLPLPKSEPLLRTDDDNDNHNNNNNNNNYDEYEIEEDEDADDYQYYQDEDYDDDGNNNDDNDDENQQQSSVDNENTDDDDDDDEYFEEEPSEHTEVRSITTRKFDTVYQRGRKLGLGAFAVVCIGTHRRHQTEYAVKQIDRATMVWNDRDALQDEISNLQFARGAPNIVQLYEVYEEKAFCYLIMEVMEGGELLECIIEKNSGTGTGTGGNGNGGTFTETEARSAIRCVLRALSYLHDNRIAHRDIKPENLLLSDPYHRDLNTIKLADFSFAKKVRRKNDCRTLCGTPGYLCPEMLERFPSYDVKCDVWSVGCLLFLLLGGYLPFDDDDDDMIFDLTREGQFEFVPDDWSGISQSAKEIVSKMLVVNPKKRISATKALHSFWIEKGDTELEERQRTIRKTQNLLEGKRKFRTIVNSIRTANRVKLLNDDFKHYLEKRKEENVANKMNNNNNNNKKNRKRQKNKSNTKNDHDFVEDSVSGRPFEDFYDIGDELGEGGYAFVYRCEHKQTHKIYAVKEVVISKMESGGESTLKDEIAALKLLRGGSHIIRLYDVFYDENNDHCFMVMEEMRGGDLLSRVCDKEVYTEREARGVCKILFEAVLYCHQKHVAHRDIKPENLLMVEADDDTSIKLADFGFAKRVIGDLSLNTLCGTAQYVAPEILDFQVEGYDERCDMWSVGVVTYILLGGYAPFEGEPDELAQFIIQGDYEFHDKYWSDISESAKDMIHNMLQTDPYMRMTAIEALQCEWMGLSPEELASKDLGGAQIQMEQQRLEEDNEASEDDENDTDDDSNNVDDAANKRNTLAGKKALQALIQTNKFLSLPSAMIGGATTKGSGGQSPSDDDDENKLGVEQAAEYDFEDCYEWGRQIGVGTFSVIHEGVHLDDGDTYAVKRIPRVDLWEEDAVALQSEIMCLQQVSDCECIAYLREVFDETDFTYMVMELLPGGYLIDKIIEKHFYDEVKGMIVAKRLITAVEFCHYHRVAIRDLKPENMLLVQNSDTEVKLSDFGHAKCVMQPNSLTTVCGTEAFVAPEIIQHHPQYDVECDMWSLGVVLYILLGGYRPFRGEGEDCLEKIRYGDYKFHRKYWCHVSDDVKQLIGRMLDIDPSRRITAEEALDCDLIRSTPDKEPMRRSSCSSKRGSRKKSAKGDRGR